MVAPGPAELVNVDELVSVSMHEMVVVVRPKKRSDVLGTRVLTDVVNAATLAGSTVVLHRRDGSVDSKAAIEEPAASAHGVGVPVPAEPAGVGFLALRSEGAIWTIDFGQSRLVRSDSPPDRLFLDASDWTLFEAVWIGPNFLSALLVDGTYVAGRRAFRQQCGPAVVDDRQAPPLLRHTA